VHHVFETSNEAPYTHCSQAQSITRPQHLHLAAVKHSADSASYCRPGLVKRMQCCAMPCAHHQRPCRTIHDGCIHKAAEQLPTQGAPSSPTNTQHLVRTIRGEHGATAQARHAVMPPTCIRACHHNDPSPTGATAAFQPIPPCVTGHQNDATVVPGTWLWPCPAGRIELLNTTTRAPNHPCHAAVTSPGLSCVASPRF
jgi:hypothetical protein